MENNNIYQDKMNVYLATTSRIRMERGFEAAQVASLNHTSIVVDSINRLGEMVAKATGNESIWNPVVPPSAEEIWTVSGKVAEEIEQRLKHLPCPQDKPELSDSAYAQELEITDHEYIEITRMARERMMNVQDEESTRMVSQSSEMNGNNDTDGDVETETSSNSSQTTGQKRKMSGPTKEMERIVAPTSGGATTHQ